MIEDNDILQLLQAKMFDSMGHSTTVVSDCISAIKALEGHAFDIILMDINLPDLDGVKCTRKIISMGIQTPIIALSGNDMASSQKDCFDAGMSAYLEKPTNKTSFNALISELLG